MKTYYYIWAMKVLVKRTIHYYINKYPNAEKGLLLWVAEFSKFHFANFNELKSVYGNASIVGNNRVIFNIKGNDFRLIVAINFVQNACYVIWFGTHKEYDKINAETIAFDTDIQNFKLDVL
jgi:mRNA interferase HigB